MTFDSLKQAVDKISVTFNGSLIFYHMKLLGDTVPSMVPKKLYVMLYTLMKKVRQI